MAVFTTLLGAAPAGRGKAKAKATATPSATPTPHALDCESVKHRVEGAAQCPEEAHQAASIVCSATGHPKLLALELECQKKVAPDDAGKSPLAAKVDAGACRALSVKDGSLLAEANVADYQACMRAVRAEILSKKCSGDAKQVEYLFLRGSQDPYVFTVRCP